MAQSGFTFIALLFAAITGVIQNPPEDLLSLTDTGEVLTLLKVEQSEDSLISLISSTRTSKGATEDLDKAVKLLREGNFKARKKAKKILNEAGEEYREYFVKLAKDPDPEVSETAKAILEKYANKKKAAKQLGMTDDVLKVLAIRRLTEMKSTKALETLKILKKSTNKDISWEAERALAIIQGTKPKRASRVEATQKLLKMIPKEVGFIAALDITEPAKKTKLSDYLNEIQKAPGIDMAMITGMFHKAIPGVVQKVGNPQLDSVVFVTSRELGVDSKTSWIGFIGSGRYNSKKVKDFLTAEGMEQKNAKGFDYWAERWGPSICPVSDELLVISFGDRGSEHMSKMLSGLKEGEASAEAGNINTKENRLVAAGALSQKQKEIMKVEITRELERRAGRNRHGAEAEKAMLELALLCTSSKHFKGKFEENVLIVKAEMDNEEKARKMSVAIENADHEIRMAFKEFPLPAFRAFNLEKRFTRSEVKGTTVTLKVKQEMIDLLTTLPFMMMMGDQVREPVAEIEVQLDEVEDVQIEEVIDEPPPVIIEE
ncbi:MAG: hypothetical protein NE327_20170 [Lentisphaeraceae bacterium]|nr:hypothetical protein [Lentisphaeraceae bacterium]